MVFYAWSWQPFGPDESVLCFTMPGFHYRGFPVIKITEDEYDLIQSGGPFEFVHKKQGYFYLRGEVVPIDQKQELILKQHDAVLQIIRQRL